MKLISVQGNYCDEGGVAYTCFSLMDQMGAVREREYRAFTFPVEARRSYTHGSIPMPVFAVAARLGFQERHFLPFLERSVLRSARKGDVVWIWPPSRPTFGEALARKGVRVVNERINTCARYYKARVDRAYVALGWETPRDWRSDPTFVAEETRGLLQSDAVFSPNPFVWESLLQIGYPEEKIIRTSYGWSPARMARSSGKIHKSERIRFLFVGTGSVRKGLPQLLYAWKAAGIDAELVVAGDLDDDVRDGCASLLSEAGVRLLGFVREIADVYRACDVFVFPTHEEGGPQVTFEAAGCGLALLVSPMGAGGGFRADEDALVVDPLDHDALVSGLRRYASDHGFRQMMQERARERAQLYTWDKVAHGRLMELERRFGKF